jgi:hypothetical protein
VILICGCSVCHLFILFLGFWEAGYRSLCEFVLPLPQLYWEALPSPPTIACVLLGPCLLHACTGFPPASLGSFLPSLFLRACCAADFACGLERGATCLPVSHVAFLLPALPVHSGCTFLCRRDMPPFCCLLTATAYTPAIQPPAYYTYMPAPCASLPSPGATWLDTIPTTGTYSHIAG